MRLPFTYSPKHLDMLLKPFNDSGHLYFIQKLSSMEAGCNCDPIIYDFVIHCQPSINYGIISNFNTAKAINPL